MFGKKFSSSLKRRKRVFISIITLFALTIGIGYAAFGSNLNILGVFSLAAKQSNVYIKSVSVTSGSATPTSAAEIIGNDRKEVDFSTSLPTLSDYYEVSTVLRNGGKSNSYYTGIDVKVYDESGNEISLPNELEYTTLRSDDAQIILNHELNTASEETFKIKFKYKSGASLPSTQPVYTFKITYSYDLEPTSAVALNSLYTYVEKDITQNGRGATYSGNHQDSLAGTGTNNIYYYTNGTYNNVILGDFCWKIIRTTDTGGVKLLYNGQKSASNTCNNTGTSSQISTGMFAKSGVEKHLGSIGYMFDDNSSIELKNGSVSATYASSVSYSNNTYTLQSTSSSLDSTHHYTCGSSATSCSTVRYYFSRTGYVELTGESDISQLLTNTLWNNDVNTTSSGAKTVLEEWYQNNMTSYTNNLEDAIWCNDRSLSNSGNYIPSKNGFNPNGGLVTNPTANDWYAFMNFRGTVALKGTSYQQVLDCPNVVDQFAVGNDKAKLTYPVGLLTAQEGYFATSSVLNTGQSYWTMTPCSIDDNYARMRRVDNTGDVLCDTVATTTHAFRPMVSLKSNHAVSSGDGTTSSPYILQLN